MNSFEYDHIEYEILSDDEIISTGTYVIYKGRPEEILIGITVGYAKKLWPSLKFFRQHKNEKYLPIQDNEVILKEDLYIISRPREIMTVWSRAVGLLVKEARIACPSLEFFRIKEFRFDFGPLLTKEIQI